MEGLDRAKAVASVAYSGHLDQFGVQPIMEKVAAVAGGLSDDDAAATVAWLSYIPVIGWDEHGILRGLFPDHITDAVYVLQRHQHQSLSRYCRRVRTNALARTVLMADIHQDTTRWNLAKMQPQDAEYLLDNSAQALRYLGAMSAEGARRWREQAMRSVAAYRNPWPFLNVGPTRGNPAGPTPDSEGGTA